jgi:hypothetical protein
MSGSQPNPPTQLQIDPQTQAYFENVLNQRLQEQEQHFLHALQQRELEIEAKHLEREREVAANDATLRQALESARAQLERAGLQSR